MPKRPTVTVALPVHNGQTYMAEALSSALAQTQPADELLVFDNASTDASIAVAQQFLPMSSIRESATNLGMVANFNRALDQSTGELFAWLAADDRLMPSFIERCSDLLAAHPSAAACLPGVRYLAPDGTLTRVALDAELAAHSARRRLRAFSRKGRWTEAYALYRRESLLASPGFLPEYGCDVLLTWWFLLRGPFAVSEEPLLEYREYPTKSVAEMAASLGTEQSPVQWRKARMWHRLWQLAGNAEVPALTRRIARQELILCLAHPAARRHVREDIVLFLESQSRRRRWAGTLIGSIRFVLARRRGATPLPSATPESRQLL